MPGRAMAALLRPQGVALGSFTTDERFSRALVITGLATPVSAGTYGLIASSYKVSYLS